MAFYLLLLRHAKSSRDDPDLDDHRRPLAKRGRQAAEIIASYLAAEDLKPDLVLCSTAKRTRQTLDRILHVWPDLTVHYEDDLYLASVADTIRLLKEAESAGRVLVVGHNPTMEDMVRHLMDRSSHHHGKAMVNLALKYPTGALAVLSLNIGSWSDITQRCGQLTHFIKPRNLEGP